MTRALILAAFLALSFNTVDWSWNGQWNFDYDFDKDHEKETVTAPIPEPTSALLFLAGGIVFAASRRRSRN